MPPSPPPRPPSPAWAATPPAERRAAVVERILEQYETRKEELARAISMEMGAPHRHAREQSGPLPALAR